MGSDSSCGGRSFATNLINGLR
ncbi:BnaA04g21220D [Brassica napus]|uniref:BnaA04g21220D protein n=1 Tax=Brassica napus TaxID=3708 RepID=A0A078FVL9_BRANA|nr:BnaA04g21220D [Brassica napus]